MEVLDLVVQLVGRRAPKAALSSQRLAFPAVTTPFARTAILVHAYAPTCYKLANASDLSAVAVASDDCDDALEVGTHVLPFGAGVEPVFTGQLSAVEIGNSQEDPK